MLCALIHRPRPSLSSSHRVDEVRFLLREMCALSLHPSVNLAPACARPLPDNIAQHRRRHLFLLFPLLADCVTVNEPSLKQDLRAVFHAISSDLGLE